MGSRGPKPQYHSSQGSPRNFTLPQLNATFLQHARAVHCAVDHWQAVSDAWASLVSMQEVVRRGGVLYTDVLQHDTHLRPECYLFLRKVVLLRDAEDPADALQVASASSLLPNESDFASLLQIISHPPRDS